MTNYDAKLAEHEPAQDSFSLYAEHIHPGDAVIVVGPNGHVLDDPTLLTAVLAAGSDGQVLIADPQYRYLEPEEYTAAAERAGSPIRGYGNVESHIQELATLRSVGIDLRLPDWLGPTATAQHLRQPDGTPVPDGSINVIVDHGTSPFLVCEWGRRPADIDELTQIYHEYARALRPGGRLLLEVPWGSYRTPDGQELDCEQVLREAGLDVQVHTVAGLMRIPIDGSVAARIDAATDKACAGFVLYSTPDGNDAIVGGMHGTATLYIAQKPHEQAS